VRFIWYRSPPGGACFFDDRDRSHYERGRRDGAAGLPFDPRTGAVRLAWCYRRGWATARANLPPHVYHALATRRAAQPRIDVVNTATTETTMPAKKTKAPPVKAAKAKPAPVAAKAAKPKAEPKPAPAPKLATANIGGAHIRAAHYLTESNTTGREYLTGVHIQPRKGGGVILTATNGRALIRVFDVEGVWPFKPAVVRFSAPALTAMRGGARVTIEAPANAELCRLAGYDQKTNAQKLTTSAGESAVIDCVYPEVERVIPAPPVANGPDAMAFDPRLLDDFRKARAEFVDKANGISVQTATPSEKGRAPPMLVSMPGAPMFGVAMPLDGGVERGLPAWRDPNGKALSAAQIAAAKIEPAKTAPAHTTRARSSGPRSPSPVGADGLNAAQRAWATRRANGWQPKAARAH